MNQLTLVSLPPLNSLPEKRKEILQLLVLLDDGFGLQPFQVLSGQFSWFVRWARLGARALHASPGQVGGGAAVTRPLAWDPGCTGAGKLAPGERDQAG